MTTSTSCRPAGATAAALLLALPACSGSSGGSTTSSSAVPSASADAPTGASGSALKTVDPAALQALVDQTIADGLIPGAVVLVRTPQGDVTVGAGAAEIGQPRAPDANTHFRPAPTAPCRTRTRAAISTAARRSRCSGSPRTRRAGGRRARRQLAAR